MSQSIPDTQSLPASVLKAMDGILRHVSDHADAKDSLEGIHRFWLPENGQDFEERAVEEALDVLVDAEIFEQSNPGGRRVFALRTEATLKARAWLRRLDVAGDASGGWRRHG